MNANKDNTYSLSLASNHFEIAKSLFKKMTQYQIDLSNEINGVEHYGFESMCGTANINADVYLLAFYTEVIDIDQLIESLAYPKMEDREDE